ncbi:MAG: VWA domain-containing protein [Planctomycetota bacterium]
MIQLAPTQMPGVRVGLALFLASLAPTHHLDPILASRTSSGPGLSAPYAPLWQEIRGTDRLLKALGQWLPRLMGDLGNVNLSKNPEFSELLGDLHIAWNRREEDRRRIQEGLLDLQGGLLAKLASLPLDTRPSRGERTALKALDQALAGQMDHEARRWLANETLLLEEQQPAVRRAAAARLLAADYRRSQGVGGAPLLPLLHAAKSTDPLVRTTALAALEGTNDDTVHLFFLRELERALVPANEKESPNLATRHLESHFSKVELEVESRAAKPINHFCRRLLPAEDWRVALVALEVSKGLPRVWAMPPLIEALGVWKERMETEGGGRRVAYALADELRERTGRALGLHPDRWQKLWKAVQAGDLTLEDGAAQARAVSSAAFFGLRPDTDRVTFVLDRSGSMDTAFGRTTQAGAKNRPGWSRYREAVEQLLHFVESLGEKAKFNVVLFDGNSSIWRSKLQEATPQSLKAVRTWLLRRKPDGGTNLREGVMRALHVGRAGEPDMRKLEADTIIVLCDGQTNSGSGWVRPFLERTQAHTRLMFHAVQIGGAGDGTLKLLSEGTGGQLVLVEE